MMLFETKRLILRTWNEDDADSLYEYAKDFDIGSVCGWPAHQNVEESKSVINNVFLKSKHCYAICLKDDNKAIGAIELMLNDNTDKTNRDDECELGYWIGKQFWGNGYIPEAATKLIEYAFETLQMSSIYGGYYDGNEKSKRVQEKLGFEPHNIIKNKYVPLLNETRVLHIMILTKKRWYNFFHNI